MTFPPSEISIHGTNNIFGENRSKFVRVFWVFIFICSFSGFCFYLYSVFVKWKYTPDIVMDSREKNSKDFPFPAITICTPLFARDNLANLVKSYEKIINKEKVEFSKSECNYFAANINWCSADKYEIHEIVKKSCHNQLDEINKIQVLKTITESSLNITELFGLVQGRNKLRRIFTRMGICFTNNMQVCNVSRIFEFEHNLKRII